MTWITMRAVDGGKYHVIQKSCDRADQIIKKCANAAIALNFALEYSREKGILLLEEHHALIRMKKILPFAENKAIE